MALTTSEEKFYVKVPTFDGKKSQWPFFRAKMRSYLAPKDLVKLLASSDPVAKDNKALDETKPAEKTKITIWEQNRKAAGLLLSCIDASTEDGEAAFAIVECKCKCNSLIKESYAIEVKFPAHTSFSERRSYIASSHPTRPNPGWVLRSA